MTVTAKAIIPSKTAESSQTTQYVATNVTTIIDKFTATNYGSASAALSINLAVAGESVAGGNIIVKTKVLQPSETYTFPEIVGHVLSPNNYISTLASAAATINIRASGREIS